MASDGDALRFEEGANVVVGMVFLVGQFGSFVDLVGVNT